MLTIPWNILSGWGRPQIGPCKLCSYLIVSFSALFFPPLADAPLPLDPSSSVLHYAQTVFEGMKAYRKDDGKVLLFRPDMNMRRMNTSAQRIALPVRIDHNYLSPWFIWGLRQTFDGHLFTWNDKATCQAWQALDTKGAWAQPVPSSHIKLFCFFCL